MRLFLIFGALFLIYCNECESKKNVVFVYDKLNVTDYDANQLYEKIKQFASGLFHEGFDFHLKIVFPHKSYIQEISKVNSTNAITTLRNDTSIKDQSTLKIVLKQIQESPSYSVIYIITNATKPTSNDTQLNNILEEIQVKRTQVNFLIENEFCFQNDSFPEYGLISSVSDGFAQMGPKLFKYHKFSRSIYMSLNSAPRKVCPLEITGYTPDDRAFCINMDSFFINAAVEELIFSSLDSNEYEIHAVDRHRTQISKSIIKDDELRETATRDSEECTHIYKKLNRQDMVFLTYPGIDLLQYDFDYGFSTATEDIRSLNETFTRPIKGTLNKIYVSSSHNKDQFLHFNLLFLNGTSIGQDIPLQPINETDLFVGSFQPPNRGYFYIQVIIHDKGATMARISNALSASVGFGENNKNPAFEYRPVYFTPKPKQWIHPEPESRPPSKNDGGINLVAIVLEIVFICMLVLVIVAVILGLVYAFLVGIHILWKFCKCVWSLCLFKQSPIKIKSPKSFGFENDRRHRAKLLDNHNIV